MTNERERIRIDFRPLSERAFARYFFEVWDAMKEKVDGEKSMPGYLQLLALLSVHAFNQEGVDVSIFEVHAGGRKDATNMFDQPVACGFTTIGLDHTDILGESIESIAWHKSGILLVNGIPQILPMRWPRAVRTAGIVYRTQAKPII